MNRIQRASVSTLIIAIAFGAMVGCQKSPESASPSTAGSTAAEPKAAAPATPAAAPTPTPTPTPPPGPTPEPLGDLKDPKHADCWAQLNNNSDPKMASPSDVIKGPIRLPALRYLPDAKNLDWGSKITSLQAGPTARVTVFEGEMYSGTSRGAQPGKTLNFPADLAKGPGSMVIEFVEPAP